MKGKKKPKRAPVKTKLMSMTSDPRIKSIATTYYDALQDFNNAGPSADNTVLLQNLVDLSCAKSCLVVGLDCLTTAIKTTLDALEARDSVYDLDALGRSIQNQVTNFYAARRVPSLPTVNDPPPSCDANDDQDFPEIGNRKYWHSLKHEWTTESEGTCCSYVQVAENDLSASFPLAPKGKGKHLYELRALLAYDGSKEEAMFGFCYVRGSERDAEKKFQVFAETNADHIAFVRSHMLLDLKKKQAEMGTDGFGD